MLARALKRMDGEDVFGNKIVTRNMRPPTPSFVPPLAPPAVTYSSDEGYATAPSNAQRGPSPSVCGNVVVFPPGSAGAGDWSRALQQLPTAVPPAMCRAPRHPPRQIRGVHGSNYDQSTSSGNSDDALCPPRDPRAISPWNSSASYSEPSSEGEADAGTELSVANLPACDPSALHDMLRRLFCQHVPVVKVNVRQGADGPTATVTLQTESDARIAISRLHRRRLDGKEWAGRRLELALGRASPAPSADAVRGRLRRLLMEVPERAMPLLRLRDVYASRHACALTSADLARVRDTVVVREGQGRMVELVGSSPAPVSEDDAPWKCRLHGAAGYDDAAATLAPVYIEMSVLAANVHALLSSHGGVLPLLSFVDCYQSTLEPLVVDPARGVALELLLRSVPGVALRELPSRHLAWAADATATPSPTGEGERVAPALAPLRTLLERELLDLLKTEPRCSIPFSRFIPAYHRHFSRQLRVADYGFTKLPELLAVLGSTVVVLGSGSSRVITLSYAAQSRRWTNDLVKLLKNHSTRYLHLKDLPQFYHKLFGAPFNPADYGACTLAELMARVSTQAVVTGPDGTISLPRREPTPEELARTHHFSKETIEILSLTPNLRIKFSQFVPTYHAHFSRQCRVSYYGCTKLAELFELIPNVVTVKADITGERVVCLSPIPARCVMAARLRAFSSLPIQLFAKIYNQKYGAAPQPDALEAGTIEDMILAAGGYVEGVVYPPGEAPFWTNQILVACAVLSMDRSIAADGSSAEYFVSEYRARTGCAPDVERLARARVVACREERVVLSAVWRAAWRSAVSMSACSTPVGVRELYDAYYAKYEMYLPYMELGFDCTTAFLRHLPELFAEVSEERFTLCAGVALPPTPPPARQHDFALFDTPPGQRGSRVFETPPRSLWVSPPACALPSPSALLANNSHRRVRLAAQFNSTSPPEEK